MIFQLGLTDEDKINSAFVETGMYRAISVEIDKLWKTIKDRGISDGEPDGWKSAALHFFDNANPGDFEAVKRDFLEDSYIYMSEPRNLKRHFRYNLFRLIMKSVDLLRGHRAIKLKLFKDNYPSK